MAESFIQEWKDLEYHGIMEPDTISECEARIRQITTEVQQIQVQLAQRKAHRYRGISGDPAYEHWKADTTGAIAWKDRERRALKDWRARAYAAVRAPTAAAGSTRYYLHGTMKVLGAILKREGIQPTSVESRFLDEVSAHLAAPVDIQSKASA